MTITEAAEKVLFSESLSDKLEIAEFSLSDENKLRASLTCSAPARSKEIRLSEKGIRASFPGINKLDDQEERGKMMHFLANHELLAAELMALVLLKFPNAPEEYRRGVYESMREEQMHTKMYLRRMKECGIEFGSLPLNSHFWRLVSPMKSPIEFVTKLNLTFEQANLDFSKFYAEKFREVGDNATAGVLEKIYRDEIDHVGHGIKWFRHWKENKKSDWKVFCELQEFPFSPAKAKGIAPFNPDGRREAGLNEEFIRELAVFEQSRGRTPVLYYFNPNAEEYVAAQQLGTRYHPNKQQLSVVKDLEFLMAACCRKDDLLMLQEKPSTEHLLQLQRKGFCLPELVSDREELKTRKLGGMRPWAWSPESVEALSPFRKNITENTQHAFQPELPSRYFSKQLTEEVERACGLNSLTRYFNELNAAVSYLKLLISKKAVLLKAPFACSGRNQLRLLEHDVESSIDQLERFFARQQSVIIEPLLDKVSDFSALYEKGQDGRVRLQGFSVMENTAKGQYKGSSVGKKWTNFLPKEVSLFLHRSGALKSFYGEQLPQQLEELMPDYSGPIGIDAMVYKDEEGQFALKKVVEVNARYSMGRIALELLNKFKTHSGTLQIRPKKTFQLKEHETLITDPELADYFLAVWS